MESNEKDANKIKERVHLDQMKLSILQDKFKCDELLSVNEAAVEENAAVATAEAEEVADSEA